MTIFLLILFMAVAVLLILVVLVQRGRGGGLAGAFGSGGGSTSAFGTKTGDVFTTVTVILFVVFMLLAIWLNMHFQAGNEKPATTTMVGPAGPTSGAGNLETGGGNNSAKPSSAMPVESGSKPATGASAAPSAPVPAATSAAPTPAAPTTASQPK